MVAALQSQPKRSGDDPRAAEPRARGRKKNDLRSDGQRHLFDALGVDPTAVEGIDVSTAMVVPAEIGRDASRFPTATYFAAWLGPRPTANRSNTTEERSAVRQGSNRAK